MCIQYDTKKWGDICVFVEKKQNKQTKKKKKNKKKKKTTTTFSLIQYLS